MLRYWTGIKFRIFISFSNSETGYDKVNSLNLKGSLKEGGEVALARLASFSNSEIDHDRVNSLNLKGSLKEGTDSAYIYRST